MSKNVCFVPPFQDTEVNKYFLHLSFEKITSSLEWPKEVWTLLLQSALLGEVYSALSVDQSSDYNVVKTAIILKAYELVPEAYQQQFRGCRKEESQTYVEFGKIYLIIGVLPLRLI